jgi:hypothetical protein
MIVLISISIPVPSQYVILNYFFSVFKCRSPSPTLSRQICTYCAGHIYIGLSVTSRLGCSCCLAYRARQPDPARAVGCCCSLCVLFGCRLSVRLPRSVARPSFVMQAWPCNGGPTNRERQGGPTNTVDAGVEPHMYPCFFTSSDHRGSVAIAILILHVYGDLPRKTNLAASEAVCYYMYTTKSYERESGLSRTSCRTISDKQKYSK